MDDTNGLADLNRRKLLAGAAMLAGGAALTSPGAAPAAAVSGQESPGLAADRRKLGALEVSAIGMGVQNMGRTFHGTIPTRSEMVRVIQAAHDAGVAFFDTAEVYGPHECERILGEAAQGFRDKIVIASKFGFNVDPNTGVPGPGVTSDPKLIRRRV